jgi:hypothetical protein
MRPGALERGAPRWARPALAAAAVACAAAVPAAAADHGARARAAQAGEPVVVREGHEARVGMADLTRVQLGRAADGRLRGALTLAAAWKTADLLAPAGTAPPAPPGSVCLRLWTVSPTRGAPADYLACVTSDARGRHLKGTVWREGEEGLQRVADAVVTRSSARTVTIRFAQSSVGRPDRIRFAGEATRPGCPRTSCIDTAPDAPGTATLALRSRASSQE